MFSNRSFPVFIIVTAVVLALLHFGRVLFIPLFFACLVSFIVYPICKWFEKKGISRSIAIGFSLFIVLLPVVAIGYILVMQVMEIGHQWPVVSSKLMSLLDAINIPVKYQVTLEEKEQWVKNFVMNNSSNLYQSVVSSVVSLVQVIIIPFYVALILYNRERIVYFLEHLFPNTEAARIRSILVDTVVAYYNFIKGMLIVYLVVGILNSIGLALLGIPSAMLYGFTAAILTFIPYVGIMIGSVLPITVAWATYNNIYYPLGVIAVFAIVQFLEANFIFPLAVSSRVKVNTLVTIIAIFLGGIVWGAAGMILFIPFVAILKLIAEKVDTLQPVSVLLGTSEGKSKQKK